MYEPTKVARVAKFYVMNKTVRINNLGACYCYLNISLVTDDPIWMTDADKPTEMDALIHWNRRNFFITFCWSVGGFYHIKSDSLLLILIVESS